MDNNKKIKKSAYSFEDRNAFLFCYLILALPLLFFIVFWVYVNFSSIVLAFQDDKGNFTFDNILEVLIAFGGGPDRYGFNLAKTLGRTVLMWFMVDIVCVVPSMLTSYVLYKKIPGASVFRVILMVPTILAGVIWISIMKEMVGVLTTVDDVGESVVAYGPVMSILQKFGVNFSNDVLRNGLLGSPESAYITLVILNMFPHFIGFNLIVSGAYAKIPADLFEVGKLEGVNFIKEFFIVAVPLIWPTVVISLITNLAVIFTFEGGVFVYTQGARDTATLGFYLYNMTLHVSNLQGIGVNYGYPAAVGVVLTAVTVPIVLFGKLFLEKLIKPVEF